jgi:hypothetical protein
VADDAGMRIRRMRSIRRKTGCPRYDVFGCIEYLGWILSIKVLFPPMGRE